MNDKIKDITAQFPEVKSLLDTLQDIKQKERRVRRRLKTKLQEFEFLEKIVGIDMKDNRLTEPLLKYFKALKLNVHRPPNNDKDGIEDLRLFHKDKMLIIEATSIVKREANEAKLTQILKHVNIRQEETSNHKVFGVIIINHEDMIPHDKRHDKQDYNKRKVKILTSNNLTTANTITLLNDFIKIKEEKMTVDELVDNLTSIGVYQ